jgi:hypothetical protein
VTPRRRIISYLGSRDPLVARRAAVVTGLDDLEHRLQRPPWKGARTVDLISHSTTEDKLLIIGDDLVDSRRLKVRAAFQRLSPLLQRVGVGAVRLLGCGTATRPAGRKTIRDLAAILQPIIVYGTVDLLLPRAFDRSGLRPRAHRVLIASCDV